MKNRILYGSWAVCLILFLFTQALNAQTAERWQQKVAYQMEIGLDVKSHQFTGNQELTYYNNSPDTLERVFYHLYFNAFQPGSMMDVRSLNLPDPDRRVGDRISKLSPEEVGYQKIKALSQDGKSLAYKVVGTILEVKLAEPILPQQSTVFKMEFEGQVPIQIRRSGRNSREGIAYSMSQWYPKICEYDYQGWHANPYIAREFHGVWGSFDVKIKIDSSYVVASTGYLQNPEQIGHGYPAEQAIKRPNSPKLTWHFKADQVHDFMWAADPDYTHDIVQVPEGPALHFFYQDDKGYAKSWKEGQSYIVKAFQFMSKNFGKYPYEKYSVVQGGDGGMEYPMATLVTGDRSLGSFVGVTVHELIHSWFQGVLASNESLYAWMDEGFTTYASALTMAHLFEREGDPVQGNYRGYFAIAERGLEEPLSTHADHFNTNAAYGTAAYSKGAVLLAQLGYVIGEENLAKGMLRYFDTWKFKHPNANDFFRVMEKVSGLELDWYKEYFVQTTHTIDYGIAKVEGKKKQALVTLERVGKMPMPLEVMVTYQDGTQELYYIPLRIMRGEKPHQDQAVERIVKPDWPWVYPEYELEINRPSAEISQIEIDPSQRMADVERANNVYKVK